MVKLTVKENAKSLIRYLSSCGIPYGAATRLVKNREVMLNGVRINSDTSVSLGDELTAFYTVKPSYNVLFSDENVLVIEKIIGKEYEDILSEVRNSYEGAAGVHRLDRNTLGVMVFALNPTSEEELNNSFKKRLFEKYYEALVYGKMPKKSETLTAYLYKDADLGKVLISDTERGDKIITKYSVIEERGNNTLLSVALVTGKTHQIRAHLAHVGHFVLGDGKYGDDRINRREKCGKLMLKAVRLVMHFEKKESPLYYLEGKEFICASL